MVTSTGILSSMKSKQIGEVRINYSRTRKPLPSRVLSVPRKVPHHFFCGRTLRWMEQVYLKITNNKCQLYRRIEELTQNTTENALGITLDIINTNVSSRDSFLMHAFESLEHPVVTLFEHIKKWRSLTVWRLVLGSKNLHIPSYKYVRPELPNAVSCSERNIFRFLVLQHALISVTTARGLNKARTEKELSGDEWGMTGSWSPT